MEFPLQSNGNWLSTSSHAVTCNREREASSSNPEILPRLKVYGIHRDRRYPGRNCGPAFKASEDDEDSSGRVTDANPHCAFPSS